MKRQAGTLSKAVLEGVMNEVDAGGSEIRVTVMPKRVDLVGDGRGFRSKKEIADWFETFGRPHDESENKVFGRFRMGRGQMFSFGVNHWRTGKFDMLVDIENQGLDYTFMELLDTQPGTKIRIDLYEQLLPSDVAATIKDLTLWCKWAPIRVYINEKLVSKDPAEHEWDHETEDAYISLTKTGAVSVYNQGIFVKDIENRQYGSGGTVVTKVGKELVVNFARNDIMVNKCPAWKKIAPFLKTETTKRNTRTNSLDDGARESLARQLVEDEEIDNAIELRLVTAVTGRHFSAKALRQLRDFQYYTAAPKGSRLGDNLMRQKIAFVIATETLERFGFDNEQDLWTWLTKRFGRENQYDFKTVHRPFETLTQGMDENYDPLTESELTVRESIWLALMRECAHKIYIPRAGGGHLPAYGGGRRRLILGVSGVAQGWTDGITYTAIEREFIKGIDFTPRGLAQLHALLVHEACHDSPSTVEHDHTQEFYEKFHDSMGASTDFVWECLFTVPRIHVKFEKSMPKRAMHVQDTIALADKAATKIETLAASAAAEPVPELVDKDGVFEGLEEFLK
jgi:hypothetical protein